MDAVNRLDSVELVLVTVNRRKAPTYQFYYFQKTNSIDGETAYLTSPESYHNKTPYKSALFLKFKKKKHFFYRADCFWKELEEHKELKQILKREGRE